MLGAGKQWVEELGREYLTEDGYSRVRYAVWLAKQIHKPLLLTGGAPHGGEAEARVMAYVMEKEFGIVPCWLETHSVTTWENAQFSASILRSQKIMRIALVSQAWHLRRAVPLFQRQGFVVFPAPTGFIYHEEKGILRYLPTAKAMQESTIALREWLGELFYALQALADAF